MDENHFRYGVALLALVWTIYRENTVHKDN